VPSDFDILFIADARLAGGTSTALASEIRAAEKAGFACGLLCVQGPLIKRLRPFHPEIRAAIDRGAVRWVDPSCAIVCRLAIVHHPMLFPAFPSQRLRVLAEHVVIVAHQPPSDGIGQLEYDIRQRVAVLTEVFGRPPLVAPVGPNVRRLFKSVPHEGVEFVPEDWHNLIDLKEWPARPFKPLGDPTVIGRHARPSDLKWPDTREEILAAYPVSPEFIVRVLGAAPFITERIGFAPANWQLLPFGSVEVRAFLAGLDVFVYFHSARWVEAFGRSILEALATGLITILPLTFKDTFEDAAIYSEPHGVRDVLMRLKSDADAAENQARRARSVVEERFSADRFGARLSQLFDLQPARGMIPARFALDGSAVGDRGPRNLLFVSTNGIGLGHLTRQLAVAKRLRPSLRPVFFTISSAVKLVRDAGYLVEHTPSHRYVGAQSDRWNEVLAEEILEAIVFHRPAAVVFDGPVPYSGLISALRAFPEVRKIWIRRAMWREIHRKSLMSTSLFDAVIEPGDLARSDDFGPTRAQRDSVNHVEPVIMLAPDERTSRDEARAELGIAEKKIVVAFQLGAGNNFEFAPVRHVLLEALTQRLNCTVLEFVSPITDHAEKLQPTHSNHRILDIYPSYRLSRAFDFAVSAAGYNSFHENILGGIPTLFIPNEAAEMDQQLTRATWAERRGLARTLRAWDVYHAAEVVAEFASAEVREDMRLCCSRITAGDGAKEIARFVEEATYAVEVDVRAESSLR
jgi:UDP:flavonoid glycosyltransferase YjiC (YdhE family)